MNAPMPEALVQDRSDNEDAYSVSLLEGPLCCDKAGVAVLELLATMRNYHQLRDFSHQERFGAPDQQSQKALAALGDVQRSLQALAASSDGAGQELVVEASLSVKMVPKTA